MYTIANVIYGVPATRKVAAWFEGKGLDYEELNFESVYDGTGDEYGSGFLGVHLGESDACTDFVRLDVLTARMTSVWAHASNDDKVARLIPNQEEVKQVAEMIAKLPADLLELLEPPGVYIVWSGS